MDKLIAEFEELLKQITNKEFKKNRKVKSKTKELKELLKAFKNLESSKRIGGNQMIKFINVKTLLEN